MPFAGCPAALAQRGHVGSPSDRAHWCSTGPPRPGADRLRLGGQGRRPWAPAICPAGCLRERGRRSASGRASSDRPGELGVADRAGAPLPEPRGVRCALASRANPVSAAAVPARQAARMPPVRVAWTIRWSRRSTFTWSRLRTVRAIAAGHGGRRRGPAGMPSWARARSMPRQRVAPACPPGEPGVAAASMPPGAGRARRATWPGIKGWVRLVGAAHRFARSPWFSLARGAPASCPGSGRGAERAGAVLAGADLGQRHR